MTDTPISTGARIRLADGRARKVFSATSWPNEPGGVLEALHNLAADVLEVVEQWDILHDVLDDVRKVANVTDDVVDAGVPAEVKRLLDALTYMATTQAAELARKDAALEAIEQQVGYIIGATNYETLDRIRALIKDGLTMPALEPAIQDDDVPEPPRRIPPHEQVRQPGDICECGHRRDEHETIDYGYSTRGVSCKHCICSAPVYPEREFG